MFRLLLQTIIIVSLATGPGNETHAQRDRPFGSVEVRTPETSGKVQSSLPFRSGSPPVLQQQGAFAPVLRIPIPSPALLPLQQDPPVETPTARLDGWTIKRFTDIVLPPYSSRDPPRA